MKLLVIAGLLVLSGAASAQSCKYELYGPYGQFITSVRTGNDRDCMKAVQACRNWKVWYVAPQDSRCIHVVDDGNAIIDYIKYPDYDTYYGYPGSPYSRVPRVPQNTQPTQPATTRYCYESRGYQTCYDVPAGYSLVCEEYDDGTEQCFYERETNTQPTPQPRPQQPTPTRPTNPAPTPTQPTTPTRPNPTNPMPAPRPTPTNPTPAPTRPTPTQPTTPTTQPTQPTTPTTPTTPAPTSTPSTDATRAIEAGETVIFNSAFNMVVAIASPNFYNLKPVNGRDRDIVKDVARQYVAVTRGCNVGFCANDSVINLATSSYMAVAGLEYDGQFVVKTVDGRDTLTFDVNASSLAWTKGCTPEGPRKVCIGNVVMRQSNRNNAYFNVVGIQLDGKVVIENTDGQKQLTTNVSPDQLIITR